MSLHSRLLHSPILFFVLLVFATIFLNLSSNTITSATQIKPVQFYSIEKPAIPHIIDPNDFNDKLELITAIVSRSTFHSFFYLDFGWALLLLINIYILSMKSAGVENPKQWFILILALAYGFDVLENLSYLTEWSAIVRYLEYTNQVKLLFYGLGIAGLVYFVSKWILENGKAYLKLTT